MIGRRHHGPSVSTTRLGRGFVHAMNAKHFRYLYDGAFSTFPSRENSLIRDIRPRVVTRKWAFFLPVLAFPATFVINAPFGRFTPSGESIFLLDGKYYSRMLMVDDR